MDTKLKAEKEIIKSKAVNANGVTSSGKAQHTLYRLNLTVTKTEIREVGTLSSRQARACCTLHSLLFTQLT